MPLLLFTILRPMWSLSPKQLVVEVTSIIPADLFLLIGLLVILVANLEVGGVVEVVVVFLDQALILDTTVSCTNSVKNLDVPSCSVTVDLTSLFKAPPQAYLAAPQHDVDPAWYQDTGANTHITSDLANLTLGAEEYTGPNKV
jgi:hypothetical protein